MNRNPFVIAFSAGSTAAAVFLIAFLGFLFSFNDAQNAIGLFLSPFLAAWVGVSVGLIALGWQHFSRSAPNGLLLAVLGPIEFCFGVLGLIVITAFLAGELYEATHPTHVNVHRTLKLRV